MYCKLPHNIVNIIQSKTEEIKQEYHIINPVIRDEIFSILDKLCIVLRFPLEDGEDANGLHVKRLVKGMEKHFVFINTNSTLEKQVYTAAHELGHVWDIDKKVLSEIEEKECYDSETIINRFAAELLMPESHFKSSFNLKCQEEGITTGEVDVDAVVKIIVELMNIFLVPYKAVVYRLLEIGFIKEYGKELLENIERQHPDIIEDKIRTCNYQKLRRKNEEKSMNGLYEMLKEAKKKDLIR